MAAVPAAVVRPGGTPFTCLMAVYSGLVVGAVRVVSVVLRLLMPVVASCDTDAVHTSPGDSRTWKSYRSSELAAPRKRTLTALPFTVSVLVMLSRVALPTLVLK